MILKNVLLKKKDYLNNNCKLINSEEFTGLVVEEAKKGYYRKTS